MNVVVTVIMVKMILMSEYIGLYCHVVAILHCCFYQAFQSMFQILTQEGWVAPLDGVLEEVGDQYFLRISVGLYFLLFHLFVSVVSKESFQRCIRNE